MQFSIQVNGLLVRSRLRVLRNRPQRPQTQRTEDRGYWSPRAETVAVQPASAMASVVTAVRRDAT
jgi:hypothetical protein